MLKINEEAVREFAVLTVVSQVPSDVTAGVSPGTETASSINNIRDQSENGDIQSSRDTFISVLYNATVLNTLL
ncbi:hypothetical protein J6590_058856 [Homalodisca vitripennis]|nr:hypothetical protein J6590_058856 [Homalodisca vitripennis]